MGVGEDISIKELAITIKSVVGYTGELQFDVSKPNGTPRKLMDVSILHNLGFSHQIPLKEGIERVYEDFLQNQETYIAGLRTVKN